MSGPHRDRHDTRYSTVVPHINDDAAAEYTAFITEESLPGRERG